MHFHNKTDYPILWDWLRAREDWFSPFIKLDVFDKLTETSTYIGHHVEPLSD